MAIVRNTYIFPGRLQGRWISLPCQKRREPRSYRLGGQSVGWQSGMEVQGELSGIERMIQEIEMGSFIRIENYQMEDLPVDEREWSFYSK